MEEFILGNIPQIFNTVRTYSKYHTLGQTCHWLVHRVISRVNLRTANPMGLGAVSVAAYKEAEQHNRTQGLFPVEWPDYRSYLLTKEDAAACTMKQNRDVWLLADRPCYMDEDDFRSAEALNIAGFSVHYVYAEAAEGAYLPAPCVSHIPVTALTEIPPQAPVVLRSHNECFAPYANRSGNPLPTVEDRLISRYYGKLSVVVLNYNNKGIIDKCVDSLLQWNDRYNYEIVVVDNQSTDGSYEQLTAKYGSRINLVRNRKNGCSSGRNLGVKVSKGDYILFLDSDQWATDAHWLDSYLYICDTAENFGAVAWNGGWFDRYAAGYMIADNYAYRSMPPSALYRNDLGYLATCGFLMSKALFEAIDGFDEYYDPTCYEDTDLTLKIRHAGKECYYSPCLGVVHLPHQTTKAGSEAHMKRITEKQKYFAEKWRQLNPALLSYIREH